MHFGVTGHRVETMENAHKPKTYYGVALIQTAFVQRDRPEMSHVIMSKPFCRLVSDHRKNSTVKNFRWDRFEWGNKHEFLDSAPQIGKSMHIKLKFFCFLICRNWFTKESRVAMFLKKNPEHHLGLRNSDCGWFFFSCCPSGTWRSTRLRNEILAILRIDVGKLGGIHLNKWSNIWT